MSQKGNLNIKGPTSVWRVHAHSQRGEGLSKGRRVSEFLRKVIATQVARNLCDGFMRICNEEKGTILPIVVARRASPFAERGICHWWNFIRTDLKRHFFRCFMLEQVSELIVVMQQMLR